MSKKSSPNSPGCIGLAMKKWSLLHRTVLHDVCTTSTMSSVATGISVDKSYQRFFSISMVLNVHDGKVIFLLHDVPYKNCCCCRPLNRNHHSKYFSPHKKTKNTKRSHPCNALNVDKPLYHHPFNNDHYPQTEIHCHIRK